MDKDFIISVTGLGYVGLPLAIEFSKKVQVIGYDRSEEKIQLYRSGMDPTNEVGDEAVKNSRVLFTSDPKQLDHANFHIIAVPTPVNQAKMPDLTAMKETSATIGKHISKGDLVVYESTVYPGVTEEVCIPILEEESGFTCGVDFGVGYSPERINPSDKIHTLPNIIKIVSGCNEETMLKIKEVYEMIIEAGTLPVSSIKTAEAIKIAENSQRDINIAFMNELAMVFDRMGVDTNEVIDG
ncbi:MAG: nucleotide sugar dehydrogenase, partial [Erysipelotrichaceae bacterium]|nr:nucleotide sugar dehydrogenase [Erysipelotrichaceae bacterium]